MPAVTRSKYLVSAGWDDVPHLDAATMAELEESTPRHLRDARRKGVPSMGSGAIYPYEETNVKYEPDFNLPMHWPMLYSLDVGWKRTAVLWGAWDRDADVVYIWSEHYRGQAEPPIHADAIRARAHWIPGVFDHAARGRSQEDGSRLSDAYMRLGLLLINADKSVEAGLLEVQQRLASGRLKIASNLPNFWFEYRLYRRDEKGKIVKENDHLMDCLRYLVMGLVHARVKPMELQGYTQSLDNNVSEATGY